jgi:hypothetical protein
MERGKVDVRTSPHPIAAPSVQAAHNLEVLDGVARKAGIVTSGRTMEISQINRKTEEARAWRSKGSKGIRRRWWGYGSLRAALRGLIRKLPDV